jgi:hypothetical protein
MRSMKTSFQAFQITLAANIGAESDTLILQIQRKILHSRAAGEDLWHSTGGDRRCAVPRSYSRNMAESKLQPDGEQVSDDNSLHG